MHNSFFQPSLITSTANPKIKNFLRFRNVKARREQNVFIIEGEKEIVAAVKNGYIFKRIFFCTDIIPEKQFYQLLGVTLENVEIIQVTKKVFAKMVYRDTSGGIVAIVERKQHQLETLSISKNPYILIVENVEKPGNLGAIFRTADAVDIDAVLFCNMAVDIYNANIIRASLGCIFSISFAVCDNESAYKWLNIRKIQIYCTTLSASTPYYAKDYTKPTAIAIGSETTGLSEYWIENAYRHIIIPMYGQADSLNASVSAALVMYEVLRQRKFAIT